VSSTPTIGAAGPVPPFFSKLDSDVRKGRRGVHGLRKLPPPPIMVCLFHHRVIFRPCIVWWLMLDGLVLQRAIARRMWMRSGKTGHSLLLTPLIADIIE